MPVWKKLAVSKLFEDVSTSDSKVQSVQCKCCQSSVVKNGSRMNTHVEKCFSCPKLVKDKYLAKLHVTTTSTVMKQVKLKIGCLIFPQVLQNQFQRTEASRYMLDTGTLCWQNVHMRTRKTKYIAGMCCMLGAHHFAWLKIHIGKLPLKLSDQLT